MDSDLAALGLAELGSLVRLAIFRLLVRAGKDGLTAGELQAHLDIPTSTLSHHMPHLIMAGLVSRVREGRNRRCCAGFSAMRGQCYT
jgi:ArsR family transcriptional regulator